MKLLKQNIVVKDVGGGVTVDEYCAAPHNFPLDGAVVHFRNGVYPRKKNKGFHEMFYVLSGELTVETDTETHILTSGDMFVIEPGVIHTSRAVNADVLIVCTPPFNPDNMEFC